MDPDARGHCEYPPHEIRYQLIIATRPDGPIYLDLCVSKGLWYPSRPCPVYRRESLAIFHQDPANDQGSFRDSDPVDCLWESP
jgi:hypothetical protein